MYDTQEKYGLFERRMDTDSTARVIHWGRVLSLILENGDHMPRLLATAQT